MGAYRNLWKSSRRNTNSLGKRTSRSRVRDAARNCIDVLESRLLLSTTTTISYPTGFASAFDIVDNGVAVTDPTSGKIQLLTGTADGEASSAFDVNQQGISTFDTTFNFDLGAHAPDADGFTFTIQNDARGFNALGGGGGNMGYQSITPSVAVKFDLWDGANTVQPRSYTASGVYTNGETPADDPRQAVTTTPAPLHTSVDFSKNAADQSSTGLDFHANPTDQYQVHLVYDGTTLTETLTDVTKTVSATQKYTINIPGIIGGNMATVGFTAGDGGARSTPEISSWVYSGVAASSAIALPAPALSGNSSLAGAADLSWTENTSLPVTGYEVDQVNGTAVTRVATLGNVNNYQVTGLNPAQSYTFEVKALGDGTTSGNSAFSNQVTVNAAGQAPGLAAWAVQPGQIVVKWNSPFAAPNGLELDASTDNGATFTKFATFGPQSGRYTFTNLDVSKTYQFKLKALGNGTTTQNSPSSNVVTVSGAGAAFGPINFPSFPSSAGLVLNGDARVTGPTGTPPDALELTHATNGETSSAFAGTMAGIDTFDTTFQFTFGTTHRPDADGFTFTIAPDPGALGGGGGDLGYTGIANSVAVAFNLYNASQSGIATNGQQAKTNVVDVTKNADGSASGVDFHAHPGDTFQAHLTYSGGTLTETLTDQTLIAQGQAATWTQSYSVDVPTVVGAHAAFVGFTAATGGANSQQDILNLTYTGTGSLPAPPTPVAVANSSAPGVVDVGWTDTITSGGFEVDKSTDGTTFTPVVTGLPGSANFYEVTGLTPGATYTFHVKSTAVGSAPAQTSNDVQITVPTTASAPISHPTGFTEGESDLQLNGTNGQQPIVNSSTGQLQLTTAGGEGTSVFATAPQNVNGFDTTFDFTYVPTQGVTPGDGFAFVLQNSPDGAGALGAPGGGLGYGTDNNANNNGGIPNSVAIKFDLYPNQGEGTDSTGLFTNGIAPTVPVRIDQADASVDMTPSGVQLGTSDTYHAHLSYDGSTLHEVVTDVTTNKTFSHDYSINLSQFLKGNTAYVGFTAGTGGAYIEQDINNWTFTHVAVSSQTVVGTAGNDTITIKKDGTDPTKDDVWVNVPTTGAPTTQVSNAQTIVVNGAGGTDTLVLDSTNGNPIPTGSNAVLRLNGGTGSFTLGGTLPTLDAAHVIDLGTSTLAVPYTGTSPLSTIQTALKGGFIKSTDAAATSGKFAIADVDAAGKVTLSYRVVGDINGDGTVGFADLLTLAQNYNGTGKDWSKGDLNYDGTVGFADLLSLAQHYNQTAAAAPAAAASSPLSAQTLASVVAASSKKAAPKVVVQPTARRK